MFLFRRARTVYTPDIDIIQDYNGLSLRKCLLTEVFNQTTPEKLQALIGCDYTGNVQVLNVDDQPHVLIAGCTGSGKSVLINTILCSLLFRHSPTTLQALIIDPKRVEFDVYNDLPHVIKPVANDVKQAASLLQFAVAEMEKRYKAMKKKHVRKAGSMFPFLLIVIDEYCELVLQAGKDKTIDECVTRLTQLGRAANIHCILATQRPIAKVLNGIIKSNAPCRIGLRTSTAIDSRIILDEKGAESLNGKGDLLIKQSDGTLQRVLCPYTRDNDIDAIIRYWKKEVK